MKNKFCDVFLANGGQNQVLITTEYDDDDKKAPHKLVQRTDLNGAKIEMSFCFSKKTELNKAFKKYNKENAEKFFLAVKEMVS